MTALSVVVYPEITTGIEVITAERAAELLATSPGNRNLSDRVVAQYRRDMVSGRWRMTGEAVKVDMFGHLRDGHHRLTAAVGGGTSFQTLVVYGVPPEAVEAMDNSFKRSFAHVLKMEGEEYGPMISGAVKQILRYEQGSVLGLTSMNVSTLELAEVLDRHPGVRRFAREAQEAARQVGVSPSTLLGLSYLFTKASSEETVSVFLDGLRTGIGLDERSPVYVLRERLIRYKGAKDAPNPTGKAELVIRAWNHYVQGLSITRLQRGPEFPAIYGLEKS